ncbi:hypothetical protein AALO_G00229870 [Alosa alosa]|uniref:Myb/SANT-like DNA-binding domain-containing protein n=1 Tax=Alosa alosa TaxID=278164 RepID=A0AAV6FUU5_9TELE|nr:hypothetical protein AALO_G00229870 [Alosa alosa]
MIACSNGKRGRGVAVGPIISQTLPDIFCDNEYGGNFLFRNNGNGTFTDVASQTGVEDAKQHGRGVALADFNRDGKIDIVYGNWNGPHRLFLQLPNRKHRFKDIATSKFSMPSPVRTVIAADFDNDNEMEVFFNNIAYRGPSANRLFRVSRREHGDPQIEELNVGEAAEPEGRGTGARQERFTAEETDVLVRAVKGREVALYGYGRNPPKLAIVKQAWEDIAAIVSTAGIPRTSHQCRTKRYNDVRRRGKSKLAGNTRTRRVTGGGSASTQDLTPAEDIAVSTLTAESFEGFGGLEVGTQPNTVAVQPQGTLTN